MEAGQYRHRVTIFDEGVTQDAFGELSPEIGAQFAQVWASVEDAEGHELFADEALHSQVGAIVRCRWRSGIVPAMVAQVTLYGQLRTFDIKAVLNRAGTRRELELLCLERVD